MKKTGWTLYVEVKDGSPDQEIIASIKKFSKKKVTIGAVPKEAYMLYMEWKFADVDEAVDLAQKINHQNVRFICIRRDL